MDKYTVSKGSHLFRLWGFAIPAPSIRKDLKTMSWTVQFCPTCAYTLPGADQRDWNKGGGVSFDLLENHTDAAMWGWRYNPATGKIELTAYCHINGKRPFLKQTLYSQHNPGVDGEVCLECSFGDTVRISFQVDRNENRYDFNFMVEGSGKSWPAGVAFTHAKRWTRTIGLWFGGNSAAPQAMDIMLKRK